MTCFLCNSLNAATKKVSVNGNSESVNEGLELASRSFRNTFQRNSLTINYDISGIKKIFDLGVGINAYRTEYGKFYVRNRNGDLVPLTSDSKMTTESSTNAYASLEKKQMRLTLNTNQPINQEYFKFQSYGASFQKYFFKKSTIFSLDYTKFQMHRPATYYRSPLDLQFYSAPTSINSEIFSLSWEQIISEKIKTINGLTYFKANEERPSYQGIFTKWAFGLTPTLFAKFHYAYNKEDTSAALKTDRGYFDNQLGSLEVSWEFIFDWVISLSYSLVKEDEEDPRTNAKRRTGVDQYGVSLDYHFSPSTQINVRASKLETNTGIKSQQIGIGATWYF